MPDYTYYYYFFSTGNRGETSWRELRCISSRLKFDKRDKNVVEKCTKSSSIGITAVPPEVDIERNTQQKLFYTNNNNDGGVRQPSIHHLQQTISLLQIILLKLIGVEMTNLKP